MSLKEYFLQVSLFNIYFLHDKHMSLLYKYFKLGYVRETI